MLRPIIMDLRFSSSKLTSSCHQWQSNLQAPDCQHQKLGKGHFKGKKITVPSGEWEWSHIPTNGIHPQKLDSSPLKMDAWKTFPQKKGRNSFNSGGGHRFACHAFLGVGLSSKGVEVQPNPTNVRPPKALLHQPDKKKLQRSRGEATERLS